MRYDKHSEDELRGLMTMDARLCNKRMRMRDPYACGDLFPPKADFRKNGKSRRDVSTDAIRAKMAEGMKQSEVAALFGMSDVSVHKRLKRA